jgi:hypothetical protein
LGLAPVVDASGLHGEHLAHRQGQVFGLGEDLQVPLAVGDPDRSEAVPYDELIPLEVGVQLRTGSFT